MIDVSVSTNAISPAGFMRVAAHIQHRFHFVRCALGSRPKAPGQTRTQTRTRTSPIPLYITDAPSHRLFLARHDRGVAVSTWQSEGLCLYARIEVDAYLVLCGLLGLIQWRALDLNPLLRIDDFIHEADVNCLFTTRKVKQDYALLLEDPTLCRGCHDFYRCLGTDPELLAIQHTIDAMRTGPAYREFPGRGQLSEKEMDQRTVNK